MKRNIENVNITDMPETKVKENSRQASLSPFEVFIQEHKKEFVEGYPKNEAWEDFIKFVEKSKLQYTPDKQTFHKYMNDNCEEKRLRRNGQRPTCYVLLEENISKFKYMCDDDGLLESGDDEIAREFTEEMM